MFPNEHLFLLSDYPTVTTLLKPWKLAASADGMPSLRGRWVSPGEVGETSAVDF